MPAEPQRIQLWRKMFPRQVRLNKDSDFPFLAGEFAIAGGDIRDVTFDAAFLAAHNGPVVTMGLIVQALARKWRSKDASPSRRDSSSTTSCSGRRIERWSAEDRTRTHRREEAGQHCAFPDARESSRSRLCRGCCRQKCRRHASFRATGDAAKRGSLPAISGP